MPVVDASVVVDWVAPDADPKGPSRMFLDRLVQQDAPVLAPRLMLEEVANALLTGVRRERWDGAAADLAFQLLGTLPVETADIPADLDTAWELSRRYDEHPVYDMLYVALAARLGDVLVTADAKLRSKLGDRWPVVGPEE